MSGTTVGPVRAEESCVASGSAGGTEEASARAVPAKRSTRAAAPKVKSARPDPSATNEGAPGEHKEGREVVMLGGSWAGVMGGADAAPLHSRHLY